MLDILEQISKLNDEQKKPVLDTEGAVLVVAGAGSGKTRVLTLRIAYLVNKLNVNPLNIMAITFTNKAADEMKSRLQKMVDNVEDMWVSTIHSMCVKILRRDIDKIGYDKYFTIYDETDKDKILKRILDDLKLEKDKFLKPVKNFISNAKNEGLNPEGAKEVYSDLKFIDEYYEIYSAYENTLAHSNSLDFDDLLLKTYTLFKEHPEVADYYSERFKYIHVDEFQDTNTVQFAIIQRLAYKNGNLFVVGDDDQSIYGWRGAKVENIVKFDDIYRGAKVYKLEQNYRSTKKILELANCIIKNNVGRREKSLWTENSDGVRVETFAGTDENNEATFVALQIKNLMARTDLSYKDFAVFMRVNAISRAIEQEFTKYGLPYKVFGGFRFFERKEIKDALSYLKLINNQYDDESFLRAVSTPKRGIGEKTLRELIEYCAGEGVSLYNGLNSLENTTIGGAAKTKLFNFKKLIDGMIAYSNCNTVVDTLQYMFETTGFLEQFSEKNDENEGRLLNLSELKNSAEQYCKDNGENANLAEYLNSVTLSSDTDDINNDDAITVATIHAVKGLEYKCVFVIGLDEKILPIIRSGDGDEDMEEERRLMYVAVTRARERLYLTRAQSRYLYGNREFMVQSRFLKEASSILFPNSAKQATEKVDKSSFGGYSSKIYGNDNDFGTSNNNVSGYSSDYAKSMLGGNKPSENLNAQYSLYRCGVKVRHKKFGEGTVITVKGEGNNLVCDVAFKGIGIKSLSVKYAPMEII